jgi:hypothetical protein
VFEEVFTVDNGHASVHEGESFAHIQLQISVWSQIDVDPTWLMLGPATKMQLEMGLTTVSVSVLERRLVTTLNG